MIREIRQTYKPNNKHRKITVFQSYKSYKNPLAPI